MWTRVDLKNKAKVSFKRNYWRSVLISVLILLMAGSVGAGGGVSMHRSTGDSRSSRAFSDSYNEPDFRFDLGDSDDGFGYDDSDGFYSYDGNEFDFGGDNGIYGFSHKESSRFPFTASSGAETVVVTIVFLTVFFVVLAIVLLLDIFILNPIEVGSQRFFYRNLNESAEVKETAYAFDHNYKNVVSIMFFRGLYIFLWSLLFVIPGIIKAYEYRMIPYLLAEHPDMPKEQAFAISKSMMDGEKWKTFVLDLSFLPWYLLTVITVGIVGIFYVYPYVFQTNAALYEALKYGKGVPYDAQQLPPRTDPYGNPYPYNGVSM